VPAVRGRCPLMLRTAWSVVRRTTMVSAPGSSMARVVSDTVHGHGLVLELAAEGDVLLGHHDHARALTQRPMTRWLAVIRGMGRLGAGRPVSGWPTMGPQLVSFGRSQRDLARLRGTGAPDRVCAGQRAFRLVVAGEGFEPSKAMPAVLQRDVCAALTSAGDGNSQHVDTHSTRTTLSSWGGDGGCRGHE
jgi:hypothetical protein